MATEINIIVFALSFTALIIYVAVLNPKQFVRKHIRQRFSGSTGNRPQASGSKDSPNKDRKWGSKKISSLDRLLTDLVAWYSEDFEQPWPQPYPDWSLETTKPLPYRPFRYGPKYYVTMGIRSMQWERWIELDNEWSSFHQQKLDRMDERESRLVMVHDQAKDAAQETLELLSRYLTKRYPSLFRYTNKKEEAIEILAT